MTSLLSSLVSNISSFPILSGQFRTGADLGKEIYLLTKKGNYPYDHIDSFEWFKKTRLPPQMRFDNNLGRCHITGEEYHDLYLITDVLLLVDVFETFREVCFCQDS